MNKQKGFTIIELIVVIAIIAVLAGIVLVNVTSYINKGKDAAAQGNLSTLLTNGAVYFDSVGNYSLFGSNSLFSSVNSSLTSAGYTLTYAGNNATNWCASVPMKATSPNNFCVDSNGKKVMGGVCASGVCP